MRKALIGVGLGLVLLYLGYAVLMIRYHPRAIYPFVQTGFLGAGYETGEVPVAGADPLPIILSRGRDGAPVVVYFMGNAGALDLFRPMLDHHRRAGRHLVAMSFRGGGGVAGAPSEQVLKRDALATLDAVPQLFADRGPVVVHGYSLGTGLALHTAARRDFDGLILSAPFHRLCELMTRASWLPACWMPGVQKWDSAADAGDLDMPVLVLHGSDDSLIPLSQAQALLRRMQENDRSHAAFHEVTGAGHIDLIEFPDYLPAIDGFIDTVAGQ